MKLHITSDKINCYIEFDIEDNEFINDKDRDKFIKEQLDKIGKNLWFDLNYKYKILYQMFKL